MKIQIIAGVIASTLLAAQGAFAVGQCSAATGIKLAENFLINKKTFQDVRTYKKDRDDLNVHSFGFHSEKKICSSFYLGTASLDFTYPETLGQDRVPFCLKCEWYQNTEKGVCGVDARECSKAKWKAFKSLPAMKKNAAK